MSSSLLPKMKAQQLLRRERPSSAFFNCSEHCDIVDRYTERVLQRKNAKRLNRGVLSCRCSLSLAKRRITGIRPLPLPYIPVNSSTKHSQPWWQVLSSVCALHVFGNPPGQFVLLCSPRPFLAGSLSLLDTKVSHRQSTRLIGPDSKLLRAVGSSRALAQRVLSLQQTLSRFLISCNIVEFCESDELAKSRILGDATRSRSPAFTMVQPSPLVLKGEMRRT